METPPIGDVTTYQWELDPEGVGASRRKSSSGVRVHLASGRLHLAALAASSGTLQLFDPAGRERARTSLRGGSASLALPEHGGVWFWRLTDRDGHAMDQGRIAIP